MNFYKTAPTGWRWRLICILGVIAVQFPAAAPVNLTILQTTDIHAHVIDSISDSRQPDWLKLATVIRRERAASTACLLIDCGDTIQGTLAGVFTRGEISARLLNHLDYDAWVPGNHELDFGTRRLVELIEQVQVPVLNGNLTLYGKRLRAWRMYNCGGARVAVIGMNSGYLKNWFSEPHTDDFEVTTAAAALEDLMPQLTSLEPDLIVLALHQGLLAKDPRGVNEVTELAARFPEIDIILGGHTHRNVAGMRSGRAWYAQAGFGAEYLARIDVQVDTEQHRPLMIKSRLIPCAGEPRDAMAQQAVADLISPLTALAQSPIRQLQEAVSSYGRPGSGCAMSDLYCRAIAERTGALVVFQGRLSKTSWPADIPVTEQLLYDAIPYENKIGIAMLTADEITMVLTEQLQSRESYVFNGIWGMKAQVSDDWRTVRELQWEPLADTRVPVAFHSYAAAGGGGRFPKLRALLATPAVQHRTTGLMTRDIVRDHLRDSAEPVAPTVHWVMR